MFKVLLRSLSVGFWALLLYFNFRLLSFDYQDISKNAEAQRWHLKQVVHDGQAASEMQTIYPEGFVFLNAIYGLCWASAFPEKIGGHEAIAEMDFALQQIESDAGTSVFDPNLPLPFGAFYNGWLNYLRGKRIAENRQTDSQSAENEAVARQFKEGCEAIARAWQHENRAYLESYPGQTWPADNIVCLAALTLHDRLFEPRYQCIAQTWLQKIKQRLDPKTGLIPHSFYHALDKPHEGARGSSQVLMLCFLPEIDPVFAAEQYQIFKNRFVAHRFGLPGVREYPDGHPGSGDIDSGPVVLGIGGAASIVGIRAIKTMKNEGDCGLLCGLAAGVDALLLPTQGENGRKFLLGKLPILDAFMTWAYSGHVVLACQEVENWRWKFQLISLGLMLAVVFLWRKMRR